MCNFTAELTVVWTVVQSDVLDIYKDIITKNCTKPSSVTDDVCCHVMSQICIHQRVQSNLEMQQARLACNDPCRHKHVYLP